LLGATSQIFARINHELPATCYHYFCTDAFAAHVTQKTATMLLNAAGAPDQKKVLQNYNCIAH